MYLKFKLEFDCNNAAFEKDAPDIEIARILRDVRKQVETGALSGVVRDFNGNTVGFFDLKADLTQEGL